MLHVTPGSFLKKIQPFGPAVWTAIAYIYTYKYVYMSEELYFIDTEYIIIILFKRNLFNKQ